MYVYICKLNIYIYMYTLLHIPPKSSNKVKHFSWAYLQSRVGSRNAEIIAHIHEAIQLLAWKFLDAKVCQGKRRSFPCQTTHLYNQPPERMARLHLNR